MGVVEFNSSKCVTCRAYSPFVRANDAFVVHVVDVEDDWVINGSDAEGNSDHLMDPKEETKEQVFVRPAFQAPPTQIHQPDAPEALYSTKGMSVS